MPIRGLTDQTDQFRAFPQIATIRKGAPKGQNQPGKDLKYFRVEFAEHEREATARFHKLYGNQPVDIDIVLPFNEIERVWEAWQEAYVAGALIHRCDGEFICYAIDSNTGEILVRGGLDVKTGQPVPCNGAAKCKPRGRLRVIVPGLQRLAYLLLVTGSKHDIINITQQLSAIRDLNGGQLAGIPLVLRRRPRKISTPGPDGKRRRYEKWLISIEADPQWVEAKIAALGIEAMPALDAGTELALPADVANDEADGDEVDTEYPNSASETTAEETSTPAGEGETVEGEVIDEVAGDTPEDFTCVECGQPIVDYQVNGETYTASKLVEISDALREKGGPGHLCGPCLKALKEKLQAVTP